MVLRIVGFVLAGVLLGGGPEDIAWTLSGGAGARIPGTDPDRPALAVTGTGEDSNAWVSSPLDLAPSTLYRVRFRARSLDARGGTPTAGAAFANHDLGPLPETWTRFEGCLFTPADLRPEDARLRFGQWRVKGTVVFENVRVFRGDAVHVSRGGVTLGAGERLRGSRYTFDAPFGTTSSLYSRSLESFRCGYNTNRFTFHGAGRELIYRHEVGGRLLLQASVRVGVTWYRDGELAVEIGDRHGGFREIGTLDGLGEKVLPVPAALATTTAIRVRLRTRGKGGGDGPAALQVGSYGFDAVIDGDGRLDGRTVFVDRVEDDPRLEVRVLDLGDLRPGVPGEALMEIRNRTDEPIPARPSLVVRPRDAEPVGSPERGGTIELPPGTTRVPVPYEVPSAGQLTAVLTLGPEVAFRAEAAFFVPEIHRADFGELLRFDGVIRSGEEAKALPPEESGLTLWWAESGFKIDPRRPPPIGAEGRAIRIRAARNEADAAQLVLHAARGKTRSRPTVIRVATDALRGPGGAGIPADRIDLLEERYVDVTRPTDETSVPGLWPDPLPPFGGPVTVSPGRNLPIWVRVRVPKDAAPGVYRGAVRLTLRGAAPGTAVELRVPLEVEVYDLALPDRMTLSTAFGFSPGFVFAYHGLTDPADRRAVLAKYFAALAAHHLSPYDPAPLDPFRTTWPRVAAWKKGETKDIEAAFRPEIDWSAWDAAMEKAIDEFGFNSFRLRVPGLGGGTFHSRTEPSMLGYPEGTPEYEAALSGWLRAVEEHLRERGWLRYAFVYWFDEPDPKDYEFVSRGFAKLERIAPGLRRMLTEQVEPELVGGPDLWCPVSPRFDPESAAKRRQAGDHFWWYVCTGPKAPYATLFVDHPSTDLRVWLWQTFEREIEGILIWQTNYWSSPCAYPEKGRPQNPWEDPMSWMSGYDTPAGVRLPWGNGDGRFLYPPLAAADGRPERPVLDGPVDSIRIEMLRDGIEDYEYLTMLRDRLAEVGEKLAPAEAARYRALLEVPPEISAGMTEFTKDPGPIERRRDRIARALERLGRIR